MPNIRKSEEERRTEIVSVKCSRKEKASMEAEAGKQSKTTSAYVLDCALAGKERRSARDKKRATQMVLNQEIINQLIQAIHKKDLNETKSCTVALVKEERKLWEY